MEKDIYIESLKFINQNADKCVTGEDAKKNERVFSNCDEKCR